LIATVATGKTGHEVKPLRAAIRHNLALAL
jgi:hypothetical protein